MSYLNCEYRKALVEEQREMANASKKVDIEIGTSDYDGMANGNVNGRKSRHRDAG